MPLFKFADFFIVQKYDCRHGNYNRVANPAEQVRNLAEQKVAQSRAENYLRIIENRNVAGGRVVISESHSELSAAARKPRSEQNQNLDERHRNVMRDDERNAKQTRERRKKSDDDASVDFHRAQFSDASERESRAHSAQKSDERRKRCDEIRRGFYHEHRAEKRAERRKERNEFYFFAQQNQAENYRKERRHSVQDCGIGNRDSVYRVKISEDSDRADCGAKKKKFERAFRNRNFFAVFREHRNRYEKRNQIPEKCFLHKRQIARKVNERAHHRKAKRREYDSQNAEQNVRASCIFQTEAHLKFFTPSKSSVAK